jgi:hypothetical protein
VQEGVDNMSTMAAEICQALDIDIGAFPEARTTDFASGIEQENE